MPAVLTQHRGMASTEPEKVGGVGLTWRVVGEGQPLEMRCKQRETTKKKTYMAGKTQQRAPEYLEKMLARRKKQKR